MDVKPPFDPAQPFEPVAEAKPPFDPSQPFTAAPADDAIAAQGARDAAAVRVSHAARRPAVPSLTRQRDPTWGDVGNLVTQTATGANEGLSSTVLRAADAIPYFASKAMGGKGVHPFESTFNKTFVDPVPPPVTDAQRMGRAGGNMLGANLENIVPVAGLAGSGVRSGVTLADQAIPGAKGVWNTIKGAGSGVLDWMAANPGKAMLTDNLGAAQAGAGGEYAKQEAQDVGIGPEGQHTAEIAGQMFAPAAMATYAKAGPVAIAKNLGTRMAKTAAGATPENMLPESVRSTTGTLAERQADKLAYSNREGKYANPDEPAPKEPNFIERAVDAGTNSRTEKAVKDVGGELKRTLAAPEAAANLAETNRLKQEIPGFEPGVARATNDPALLNKQQNFEAAATGDELRQRQAATDTSRGAIKTYMDETVPPAEAPRRRPEQMGPLPATDVPQDSVSRAVTNRVRGVNDRVEQQATGVRTQIQQRSDTLPEVDRAATGQTLREIRHGEQGAADAEVTRLRGAIAEPETPIQVGDQTMTVNAALDRRAAINQETRRYASANSRNVEDVRAMEQLAAERDALDRSLERVNLPGMREYTSYYREQYAPRFLEGPSRDVGRYSQTGIDKNRMQSEDVPGAFFKPNNISEARQFNRLYGEGTAPETQQARQAMTDYALDDLRHSAVDPNTGVIREGAVNRWLQKNERILNEMPWIRDAVDAHNPEQLYGRLGQLEGRQRAVGETKVAGVTSKNPEQTIAAAVADHTVMRGLKASVRGDPQAEAALARAVWDHVGAAAGEKSLVNADALEKMLLPEAKGGNRRALAEVLTPQHLNRLENVIKASRIEARLPRPSGTYEKTDNAFSAIERTTGTSVPTAGATVSALARGRSSPVYEVPRLIANFYRGMTEREANAVWKEALYKPEVLAKVELAAKGGKATPIQLNRMHNYLATVTQEDEKKAVAPNVEN